MPDIITILASLKSIYGVAKGINNFSKWLTESSNEPLAKSIQQTIDNFSNIEGLKNRFEELFKSEDFNKIISEFENKATPANLDDLSQLLIDEGFYYGEESHPKAKEIWLFFFESLHKNLLTPTSKQALVHLDALSEGREEITRGKIINEITQSEERQRQSFGQEFKKINNQLQAIQKSPPEFVNIPDTSITVLTVEYQAELDHAKELLSNYRPIEALNFLESLRSRIWASAKPIIKYRILTNMGSAKLNLNQYEEAAKLFIEALQYNPEDEKALCNVALGHILLKQNDKAMAYAYKVVDKNPANSRAYATIVQTSPDDELVDIIAKVPEPYQKAAEVAYAIGYVAGKKHNYSESQKWFEIALQNDKGNIPDFKAALGEAILKSVTKNQPLIYAGQIDDATKGLINKSIRLLTEAWECISGSDIKKFRLEWIMNRGLGKRLLGQIDEAIKDVEVALAIESSNPIFILQRAILARENSDDKKAIELLEKIITNKQTPGASLLLTEILRNKKDFPGAIKIIKQFLDNNQPKPLQQEATSILIQLYIDSKDIKSAKNVSSAALDSEPNNIINIADEVGILRLSGNKDIAVSRLKEAKQYITSSTPFKHLMVLANEFYSLEQFEDAAILYERIADKNIDSSLTRRLLNCYYQSGETGKALEICKGLRKKYGPLKYVSEMESAIYEDIGDLNSAKQVCHEYLKLFPDDMGMKLRQAVIDLRSNNFIDIDKFLDSFIDIKSLSLEQRLQIAYLYSTRNRFQEALKLMYETRRQFFNNSDAHLKYIGFLFHRENDFSQLLRFDKVSVDTAVCIEDGSGLREWYIIEERESPEIQRREINLTHPIASRLIDKTVGNKVVLQESQISKEEGKIVEIKSKYVYALHESLSIFEKIFPDTPGLWGIKIERPDKEGEPPKGFEPVLEDISRQHEIGLKIDQLYKEGPFTLGAIATVMGKNVLDVWTHFISKPELGVKCCAGTTFERTNAIQFLNDNPKLIIDVISIMTLYYIKGVSVITTTFGELGIAQSSIDLLQNTINERKGIMSKGFTVISKEGDKFVKQQIGAEMVKRHIEDLENIMELIKNNCEVIPCKASLFINKNKKQEFNELTGKSFVDTILIANEHGRLLYSDDERLRSFAKEEFSVNGIWTQALLMYCLDKKTLGRIEYNDMVIKIAASNYYHTSVDAKIMIESAKQSNWGNDQPYKSVLSILGEAFSDENSALNVATDFLYELKRQSLLVHQQDSLTYGLLDVITAGRNKSKVLVKLNKFIQARFKLWPQAGQEMISLINTWKQGQIL